MCTKDTAVKGRIFSTKRGRTLSVGIALSYARGVVAARAVTFEIDDAAQFNLCVSTSATHVTNANLTTSPYYMAIPSKALSNPLGRRLSRVQRLR